MYVQGALQEFRTAGNSAKVPREKKEVLGDYET